jgi:hypothetical protein
MLVYGENKFFNIYFFILGCPNGTFGYKCERVCDSNHYGMLCHSTCDCKSNETYVVLLVLLAKGNNLHEITFLLG